MERQAASGTAWEETGRDQELKSCRVMVCSISLCEFGTALQWLVRGEAQWQIKHKHLLVGTALPVSQAANCERQGQDTMEKLP